MARSAYVSPVITVEDADTRGFRLMATSYGHTSIAGTRLLRAEPWPAVKFAHPDRASAEKDAQVLREYLGECASGKRKDSDKPQQKPHWED